MPQEPPAPPPQAQMRARLTSEAVVRHSYGRLVALLTARTGDVAAAEDALADALAAALTDWPRRGIPEKPEAWLLTAARRRWIDAGRRQQTASAAALPLRQLGEELAAAKAPEDTLPDRRLAFMFACAHPAIDPPLRAPLILQTLLGFDAARIGSAFLVSPSAMAQRLVRAKRKIRQAGIPLRVPEPAELPERIAAVLDAIYAAFAEGWENPAGTDPHSRELAEEAIWLGRLVGSLLPEEPEALGLLALMLHAHARRHARRGAAGEYVPLEAQDPTAWDGAMIDEAEALLARANALPGAGRFQLEAAVQSAHAVRRHTGRADWPAIEALYQALHTLTDSPVVALNLAVARAETQGARAGLEALARLAEEPRLAQYQPYWAARAHLLARCDEAEAADAAYARAIGLESDPAVRRFLEGRRDALRRIGNPGG